MLSITYGLDGGLPVFEKDPAAVRPFGFDLGAHPSEPYLQTGETLEEVSWSIDAGNGEDPVTLRSGDGVTPVTTAAGIITPAASTFEATGKMVVWLYGGTPGASYTVTATFRIASGGANLVDDRSMTVKVVEL